jgi:excisionase family DNA binding protein
VATTNPSGIERWSPPSVESPELLTARELESMLKISTKTIYAYVQRGLIPYVKIQSNVRFPKSEILTWIKGQSYRPRTMGGNGR